MTASTRIFEEQRGQSNGSTSCILAMSLAQAERQADSVTVQVGDCGGELPVRFTLSMIAGSNIGVAALARLLRARPQKP